MFVCGIALLSSLISWGSVWGTGNVSRESRFAVLLHVFCGLVQDMSMLGGSFLLPEVSPLEAGPSHSTL